MVDKNSDEFRIGFSENVMEDRDSAMQEEILEQRLEKLSTRVTLISILVPVLILVIFTFAYLDIKSRVFTMHDTGVERLHNLSRELESKFSSLSIRLAQFEASFSEREKALAALEETFAQKILPMEEIFLNMETSIKNLETGLQELENDILEIQSVQKNSVGKQELALQLERMEKYFNVTQNDMETLMAQMGAVDQNFKDELEILTDYLTKEKKRIEEVVKATTGFAQEVQKVRSDLGNLSQRVEGVVHADQLPLAIERARLQLKVALDEAIIKMERRLDSLDRKISLISSQTDSIMERNLQ
jgi:ribosome-associated translation inhibitor RaiA